MVLKGKGTGEGANNAYTRIIYRVYKRLHQSCYIIYDNVTPLLCDSVTNITEGDISSIRVPELARALIAIIKRACEFDYCLNRTIGCDINVLCTCRK